MKREKLCKKCETTKPITEFHGTGKHTSVSGKVTKLYKPICKSCANAEAKQVAAERLVRLGVVWVCVRCGYDKCIAALDLHHKDPSQKSFRISSRWTASDEVMKAEVEKCEVLCSNCHREEHFNMGD